MGVCVRERERERERQRETEREKPVGSIHDLKTKRYQSVPCYRSTKDALHKLVSVQSNSFFICLSPYHLSFFLPLSFSISCFTCSLANSFSLFSVAPLALTLSRYSIFLSLSYYSTSFSVSHTLVALYLSILKQELYLNFFRISLDLSWPSS